MSHPDVQLDIFRERKIQALTAAGVLEMIETIKKEMEVKFRSRISSTDLRYFLQAESHRLTCDAMKRLLGDDITEQDIVKTLASLDLAGLIPPQFRDSHPI